MEIGANGDDDPSHEGDLGRLVGAPLDLKLERTASSKELRKDVDRAAARELKTQAPILERSNRCAAGPRSVAETGLQLPFQLPTADVDVPLVHAAAGLRHRRRDLQDRSRLDLS